MPSSHCQAGPTPISLSPGWRFELGALRALGSPISGHDRVGRSDHFHQPIAVSRPILNPRPRAIGPFGPLRTAHQSQPFVIKSKAGDEWADRTMHSARLIQAVHFRSRQCLPFLFARDRAGCACDAWHDLVGPRGFIVAVGF